MPKHLNIVQLCAAAQISRATAYRWIEDGLIPPPKKKDGAALWEIKPLREALARRGRLLLA